MIDKYKTFEEIYTREQIRKIGEVYRTKPGFDWEYCPVVFSFPCGFSTISCSEGDELDIHIKAGYMLKLWEKAIDSTKKEYPDFLKHTWQKEGYFKFIHYLDTKHKDSLCYFWKQLKAIADSGSITIKESKTVDEKNKMTLVCHSFSIFGPPGKHYTNKSRSYVCSDTEFTYSWDEVKQYFIELSDKEVSFLHGDEMNDYDPSSQPLFDACEKHDYEGVKKAVESGIDVNSLDKYARTPLCAIIPAFPDDFEVEEISKQNTEYTKKIIKIMDYLLEKGANINLYGFDGFDCLTNAHYCGSTILIEYLFQHGLNRYCNKFITDLFDEREWYIMNAVYDYVETDLAIGDYDMENLLEQEKILERNGVEFFIEGWDNEKLKEYYATLPDLYS